jgi:hypothetical protein
MARRLRRSGDDQRQRGQQQRGGDGGDDAPAPGEPDRNAGRAGGFGVPAWTGGIQSAAARLAALCAGRTAGGVPGTSAAGSPGSSTARIAVMTTSPLSNLHSSYTGI